ncbi:MAG: hypothetical protein EXR69_00210 [Myxococcales bacterium]|nr:hypothetical protein [Myxococcales bacterium]
MPSQLPPIVGIAQAMSLVGAGATVLDTRSLMSFLAAGHILGAVHTSWRIGTSGRATDGGLGDAAAAATAFAGLGVSGSRPVLVVGDWDLGWGEEGRIYWDLDYLGHPDVHVLRGGMVAWTGARTRRPAGPATAGDFIADPRSAERIGTGQLAAWLEDGTGRVVDVREPAEFSGATPYGESRAGHIPGALNVPWKDLFAPAGLARVPAGQPIVVTCTGGVRSGMAWLLLRNAGFAVAHYDEGMWGWARTGRAITTGE